MSSPATSALSTELRLGFWQRAGVALGVSFFVGLPVCFLGVELGFISSGDEGRWQPYTAFAGLIWATVVFAFTYPAARLRWNRGEGVAAAALSGLAASMVVFLASIFWLFFVLLAVGYEP
jgi:hypothetical protein